MRHLREGRSLQYKPVQTDPRGERGEAKPCVCVVYLTRPPLPSPLNEPLRAKSLDITVLFSSLPGTQNLHDSRRAVLGLGGSVSVGQNAGIPASARACTSFQGYYYRDDDVGQCQHQHYKIWVPYNTLSLPFPGLYSTATLLPTLYSTLLHVLYIYRGLFFSSTSSTDAFWTSSNGVS